MADFKAMMAAKNKKSVVPEQQISAVEPNIIPKIEKSKEENPKAVKKKVEPTESVIIDKTNLSLSRSTTNYIKINSRRQRKTQVDYMSIIIEELQKSRVPKKVSYEEHRRVINDRTTFNLILPHNLMEWVRDTAADEGVGVSQFIDEIIQSRIEEE